MAKNQAIVIGINKYNPNNFTPLNYAKNDAELVREFFEKEVGFEKVYFFSDDSPDITLRPGVNIPSQPTLGNLESFLLDRFEKPCMKAGDNFWFFFAGHGLRYADRDYLMPCDGNPRNVERTAIPVSYVTERLRRCGADNVILILDACRNLGGRGLGIGGEHQQGVITIFSCSPSEISYEIKELQHGAFTHVLLEALRIQGEGNCATVERLYYYLSYRVPEFNHRYNKPRQTPYIIAEPATKLHLILLPKYATLRDIETLKVDALKAESEGNLELARQLWIRANIAASGSDMEAIEAFQRISQKTEQSTQTQKKSDNQFNNTGQRSSQKSYLFHSFIKKNETNNKLKPDGTSVQFWTAMLCLFALPLGLILIQIVIQIYKSLNNGFGALAKPEAHESVSLKKEKDNISGSSQLLALQPGVYKLKMNPEVSSMIVIAQEGERICYQGISYRRGSYIKTGSVMRDINEQSSYRIHGFNDAKLTQKDNKTLLFDNTEFYLEDGQPWSLDKNLKKCLQSTEAFSIQEGD